MLGAIRSKDVDSECGLFKEQLRWIRSSKKKRNLNCSFFSFL